MSKLTAPCPHCGGKVAWCDCHECDRIECKRCGSLTEFDTAKTHITLRTQRAYAAEMWNQRADKVPA